MNQLKDIVIILKSINFSEADKILTVFGRQHGKFGIIAKGIRKMTSKNRGNMQTLSVTEITYFEGRNLAILKESSGKVLIPPEDIDMDSASKLLFILNKLLPEGESEPELFDQIEEVIKKGVNRADVNRLRLRILQTLGYISLLRNCEFCGNSVSKSDWFDQNRFCCVCQNCAVDQSKVVRAGYMQIEQFDLNSSRITELVDREVLKVLDS